MSAAVLWLAVPGDEWLPAVNCLTCGRFVGKDGVVEIGYFEMSSEIAYVEGECARCLAVLRPPTPEGDAGGR